MGGLTAPFPWFGGKSRAAALIWQRLGPDVASYVEPFAGSLAVLLGRPGDRVGVETVNDADGFLCNLWRAIQADPALVARWADWPVSECDLSARHIWLVERRAALTERLQVDPDYHDAKIAGWWLWGICCWIGSGWCSGTGPWTTDGERWVNRQLPHLGDAGMGVNRKLPHLGGAGRGVNRQLPHLSGAGMGVNRKLPHLGDAGRGGVEWMETLSARLRRVRVACGDWRRVVTDSVLTPTRGQPTGILLDPPYPDGWDTESAYSAGSAGSAVWHDAAAWAIEAGRDPSRRIALCGYVGTWEPPDGWETVEWKASGGYGSQGDGDGRANSARERIWFSPGCLRPMARQPSLFGR